MAATQGYQHSGGGSFVSSCGGSSHGGAGAHGRKRAESARARRAEQLRRWRGSLTEQESAERQGSGRQLQTRRGSPRVRFEDGAVFLAACSSGDTDEVKKLLARGADINTVNVDGLTALHQVGLPFGLLVLQACDLSTAPPEVF